MIWIALNHCHKNQFVNKPQIMERLYGATTFSGIIHCFSSLIANVQEFFSIVICITYHQSTLEETDMKLHIELYAI